MTVVPLEYQGREQSYLKHRVLREYMRGWGMKLGSVARKRSVRLCYVDAFAGPWSADTDDLSDTSIAIGLDALELANAEWSKAGARISVDAMFVEKDPKAFERLERYLAARGGVVKTTPLNCEFGQAVPEIVAWMARDAGFIFVDPKGWKGAAMKFIAPLITSSNQRDVMVNVMYDHINRFKDDQRAFLREQMRDLFGLEEDLPETLGEEELFALYRKNLKEICHLRFAADLAIPYPTKSRTKFRLVVGGRHASVIDLFRSVEAKVIGREAAAVRGEASAREEEARTGQTQLALGRPDTDEHYDALHDAALREAPGLLRDRLAERGPTRFSDLWPPFLEELHMTLGELARVAWQLKTSGVLRVRDPRPRVRTIGADDVLEVSPGDVRLPE